MQQEIERLTKINHETKRSFQQERDEMRANIEGLEKENKEILSMLIKHSKGEQAPSNILKQQRPQTSNVHDERRISPAYNERATSRGYQESPPKIPKTKEFTYSKYGQGKKKNPAGPSGGKRSYKGAGGNIGQTQMRNLSLKQLKDIIQDIYEKKLKYDQKCEEDKLPRETMEQYMYTYLNQRYGLKSLIIEWAASIINGIKKYSKEDHSISLYGKILRNECDEEFRFIQKHVRDTLDASLRAILKDRFPNKSEQGIQELFVQITKGFIDDYYWARIIERMYDEQD